MTPGLVRQTCVAALAMVSAFVSDRPSYVVTATIPDRVDGQPLRAFACDPAADRLYLGSDRGLFYVDLGESKRDMRIKGPMFRKDIVRLEFAENLGRLFYVTDNEVGYVDVRAGGSPVRVRGGLRVLDTAYEPTRRELYVATRDPYLSVFDAQSGEFGFRLALPGWFGHGLEAAPGRVYAHVSPKPELHVVDAATHRVAPWPVAGIATPAYLEADPEGRYLFGAYDRYVVAIDARTAKVIGRVVTPFGGTIAFDPGSRLLIGAWDDDPPPTKLAAYRVDDAGLTPVAKLDNPRIGGIGVEATNRGFVQHGTMALIVWKFQDAAVSPGRAVKADSSPQLFPALGPARPSGR